VPGQPSTEVGRTSSVHLPGGKNVVIDSKAPFDAFERPRKATGEGGARRRADGVRPQGAPPCPGARPEGVLGARDAVRRLHVHVPARRRIPRGRRGTGRGSLQLRVRARRAARDAPHDRGDAAHDPRRRGRTRMRPSTPRRC
jgi:hypothetical protein